MSREVLIVDDDDLMRSVLRVALSRFAGWNVRAVSSGADCLWLLESSDTQPEVILLDYQMPDMDGLETLRRLKELPGTERIHVIFITAAQTGVAEALLDGHGAAGLITKPFEPDTLGAEIETMLGWAA